MFFPDRVLRALRTVNPQVEIRVLVGELFYGLKELQVIVDQWVRHYNTERTHGSVDYRPPAPQAWVQSQARLNTQSGITSMKTIHL
ncbi:MAG TPA: integrase core domain-containing protein [Burkholderiales bacterium]